MSYVSDNSKSTTLILVVEDDFLNRSLMFKFLVKLGYKVVMATNGQDGINLAKHLLPDLIVMDIELPIVHGYEAIKEIKAWGETSKTPILCVSANVRESAQEEAYHIGCDDFEGKPFKLQEFASKISDLLDSKSEEAETV